MDSFKVIIAPEALEQLNSCVRYIRCILLNPTAAESVYDDAIETGAELSTVAGSLKFCDNERLRRYGYRAITFRRHQYVMIYRTEGAGCVCRWNFPSEAGLRESVCPNSQFKIKEKLSAHLVAIPLCKIPTQLDGDLVG